MGRTLFSTALCLRIDEERHSLSPDPTYSFHQLARKGFHEFGDRRQIRYKLIDTSVLHVHGSIHASHVFVSRFQPEQAFNRDQPPCRRNRRISIHLLLTGPGRCLLDHIHSALVNRPPLFRAAPNTPPSSLAIFPMCTKPAGLSMDDLTEQACAEWTLLARHLTTVR